MLHKMVMAGVQVMAKLPPVWPAAVRTGRRHSLPAPHFRRSLTGQETREAARNAKAHLLRAAAVADEQHSGLAQSKFLDLSVDDRVVVKPAAVRLARGRAFDLALEADSWCLLSSSIQGRLRESAVLEPTAVQQAAIPAILSGRNVALQCYTGSGKVHNMTHLCLPIALLRCVQCWHRQSGALARCAGLVQHALTCIPAVCRHTLAYKQ